MKDFKYLINPTEEYKQKGIESLHYCKYSYGETTWYCGYVTLNKTHPLYDVDDIESTFCEELTSLDVHGGITYSNRTDKELVIGFDQNHSSDHNSTINDDAVYVTNEIHRLADQLCNIYTKYNAFVKKRKIITNWYINDFLDMANDLSGASDHLEHGINSLSDEYFEKHIETLWLEEFKNTEREGRKEFLLWNFGQDEENILLSLGERVRDALLDEGKFSISMDDLYEEAEIEYEENLKNNK